jgi:hypothetical protein
MEAFCIDCRTTHNGIAGMRFRVRAPLWLRAQAHNSLSLRWQPYQIGLMKPQKTRRELAVDERRYGLQQASVNLPFNGKNRKLFAGTSAGKVGGRVRGLT